jgi:hypothetical protein
MREVTRSGRRKIKNMERRENDMESLVRRELEVSSHQQGVFSKVLDWITKVKVMES